MSTWFLPDGKERLDDLVRDWLDDMRGVLDPGTIELYRLHFAAHLIPHFGTPQAIVSAAVADYGRKRLRVVKRSTLQKERATLRGFLAWCAEKAYLDAEPELPKLPKRATGTPYEQRRRGTATALSPEECRAVVAALPLMSNPRNRAPFVVRDRFVVAYDTALRPATLDGLSVPEHYSRGELTLRISDAIDKARFGREVPLTPVARAALDRVAPAEGVVFGRHDYRDLLAKAATRALSAVKARTFTAYDLRHARLTELAETGNLTGAAYLAGHRRVTTTSIYVRPGLKAAERALDSVAQKPGNASYIRELSAKERTRTSTGINPLAPQATSEASDSLPTPQAEATALLRLAADGTEVGQSRLDAFLEAAAGLTELSRLVLAAARGGGHGPRRMLELARFVDGMASAARDEAEGAL